MWQLAVLRPVWNGPNTAPGCRVRGLIERVLAGAQPSTTSGKQATLHGFRSSFTTWTEATGRSERIAQLCLSHQKKNEADQPMDPVSLAYARHDYMEERATLLQDWSDYLSA